MIKQRITIDPEVIEKNHLSLGEFLFTLLFLWGYNPEELAETMVTEGSAYYDNDSVFPKKETVEKVKDCLLNKIPIELSDEEILNLAIQLKEIYPKGLSEYGVPWTEGKLLVAERLKGFFSKYGSYSAESVINATKKYVEIMEDSPYMRTLKNFIFRESINPSGTREVSSDLYTYLESSEDMERKTEWTAEFK